MFKRFLVLMFLAVAVFACGSRREEVDDLETPSAEVSLASAPVTLSKAAANLVQLTDTTVSEGEKEFLLKVRFKATGEISASDIFLFYEINRQAEGRKLPVFPQTFIRIQGPIETDATFEVEIAVARSGLPGPRTVEILNMTDIGPAP